MKKRRLPAPPPPPEGMMWFSRAGKLTLVPIALVEKYAKFSVSRPDVISYKNDPTYNLKRKK